MAARQIMTRGAGTIHLVMIHRKHRHPAICGMTSLTDIGGINMIDRFARSSAAVVTRRARTDDFSMINPDHRRPAQWAMTSFT